MFDPEREAEWAEGWSINAVHPKPFRFEPNAVFEVPGPQGVTEVWTIVAIDRAACRVEYLAVAGNDLVRRVTVQCHPADEGTRVTVHYLVTAWTSAGAARAAGYDHGVIEAWPQPGVGALNPEGGTE